MISVTPVHVPVLAAMHELAFPHEPWSAESLIGVLAQPGMVGLIDERGGFLLLRVVADEAEIITIGVTALRQGIASGLLRAGLEEARARGAVALYLEVAETNAPARALYARFGFETMGRRRRYYADGSDALTLRLALA